jgi:hypothetical protein
MAIITSKYTIGWFGTTSSDNDQCEPFNLTKNIGHYTNDDGIKSFVKGSSISEEFSESDVSGIIVLGYTSRGSPRAWSIKKEKNAFHSAFSGDFARSAFLNQEADEMGFIFSDFEPDTSSGFAYNEGELEIAEEEFVSLPAWYNIYQDSSGFLLNFNNTSKEFDLVNSNTDESAPGVIYNLRNQNFLLRKYAMSDLVRGGVDGQQDAIKEFRLTYTHRIDDYSEYYNTRVAHTQNRGMVQFTKNDEGDAILDCGKMYVIINNNEVEVDIPGFIPSAKDVDMGRIDTTQYISE